MNNTIEVPLDHITSQPSALTVRTGRQTAVFSWERAASGAGLQYEARENVLYTRVAADAPESAARLTRHLTGYAYEVAGEPFFIEFEGDDVFIRHPKWSLLGNGSSLREAEDDLRNEARELSDVLSAIPAETLNSDAVRLRDFVSRLV
jgi:hypothetical protein